MRSSVRSSNDSKYIKAARQAATLVTIRVHDLEVRGGSGGVKTRQPPPARECEEAAVWDWLATVG